MNGILKTLHEKNKKGRMIKTHTTRKAIEEEIIDHNQKNVAMVVRAKVCQDKTNEK